MSYSYAQKLAQRGITAAFVATMAGVSKSAISNYFARRYAQCGKVNRRRIEAVLIDMGIKAAPDPKAAIRRKYRAFHLAGGGLRKEANLSGPGHTPDGEIHEMIFGTIK